MPNVSGSELLILALVWGIPIIVAYWVIRLAVRHGVTDAHRKVEQRGEATR